MHGLFLLLDRARPDRVCGGAPEVDAASSARHSQCISEANAPEGLPLSPPQEGKIESDFMSALNNSCFSLFFSNGFPIIGHLPFYGIFLWEIGSRREFLTFS